MTACGIIAEYNPFHSGHAYQIEQARRLSGREYIIAVMSGDFVQRGAPAIADKYVRASQAISAGADLVIMLPVYHSTASAEGFAGGAVAALLSTGVVDAISFGCEDPEICGRPYRRLAEELAAENAAFSDAVSRGLTSGKSYARARADAIAGIGKNGSDGGDAGDGGSARDPALLERPNNLLAFEYMRAITKSGKDIRLFPVRRIGRYHDSRPGGRDPLESSDGWKECRPVVADGEEFPGYASSESCRSALVPRGISGKDGVGAQALSALDNLESAGMMPHAPAAILRDYMERYPLLDEDDISEMLHYALLAGRDAGYAEYLDCGDGLSGRILRHLPEYEDFSQFRGLLKNKSVTYARISRALVHILLNLPARMPMESGNAGRKRGCGGTGSVAGGMAASPLYAPYIRVLGFRKDAGPLLHEIKKWANAPLIVRPAEAKNALDPAASAYFTQDLLASDIYRAILLGKCGRCYPADPCRRFQAM